MPHEPETDDVERKLSVVAPEESESGYAYRALNDAEVEAMLIDRLKVIEREILAAQIASIEYSRAYDASRIIERADRVHAALKDFYVSRGAS